MDLETRKKEFVQEFLKIRDEEVIARLEKMLRNENECVQDNSKPMSVEEFNLRIDQSMEDSRRGKLIKAADLKASMKKWG